MTPSFEKTIVLGDEYDERLREVLLRVLAGLGAAEDSKSWALAGSQELQELDVTVKGQRLRIESETYVGLSISGNTLLVGRIAELVKQGMTVGKG